MATIAQMQLCAGTFPSHNLYHVLDSAATLQTARNGLRELLLSTLDLPVDAEPMLQTVMDVRDKNSQSETKNSIPTTKNASGDAKKALKNLEKLRQEEGAETAIARLVENFPLLARRLALAHVHEKWNQAEAPKMQGQVFIMDEPVRELLGRLGEEVAAYSPPDDQLHKSTLTSRFAEFYVKLQNYQRFADGPLNKLRSVGHALVLKAPGLSDKRATARARLLQLAHAALKMQNSGRNETDEESREGEPLLTAASVVRSWIRALEEAQREAFSGEYMQWNQQCVGELRALIGDDKVTVDEEKPAVRTLKVFSQLGASDEFSEVDQSDGEEEVEEVEEMEEEGVMQPEKDLLVEDKNDIIQHVAPATRQSNGQTGFRPNPRDAQEKRKGHAPTLRAEADDILLSMHTQTLHHAPHLSPVEAQRVILEVYNQLGEKHRMQLQQMEKLRLDVLDTVQGTDEDGEEVEYVIVGYHDAANPCPPPASLAA